MNYALKIASFGFWALHACAFNWYGHRINALTNCPKLKLTYAIDFDADMLNSCTVRSVCILSLKRMQEFAFELIWFNRHCI